MGQREANKLKRHLAKSVGGIPFYSMRWHWQCTRSGWGCTPSRLQSGALPGVQVGAVAGSACDTRRLLHQQHPFLEQGPLPRSPRLGLEWLWTVL